MSCHTFFKKPILVRAGVRTLESGARYRIVELTPGNSKNWLKNRIAQDYSEKQQLTLVMEQWYASGKKWPVFR
jgi:hypothetical protein